MKKLTALLLSGSIFFSTAPIGFAAETCTELSGFEQEQCLRRDLRKQTLEKRSSRILQRTMRKINAAAEITLPTVGARTRAVLRNIPTRRSQLLMFKERAKENARLRNERTKLQMEQMSEEMDASEDESEDTEEAVIKGKVEYRILGRGRAKLRRFQFLQPENNEE
ncbi:MAG: hypothetical protein K9M03_01820 [Kiritimatiellales bacterium]|nr:hypothetical protein [Kiritimatiellales bacterium]